MPVDTTENQLEIPQTLRVSQFDHPEISRLVNYNKRLITRWQQTRQLLEDNSVTNEQSLEKKREFEFLTNLIKSQENLITGLRDQYTVELSQDQDEVNLEWVPIDQSGVEQVMNKKQLKFSGNKYNYHHTLKSDIMVYRCNKYRPLRCQAQILFDPHHKLIKLRGEHNHAIQEKRDKPLGLTEHRRTEMYLYLKDHPNERNALQICENLNRNLQPHEKTDPRLFVRSQDVREMMRLFQNPRIGSIEEIVSRPDLALTEEGHPFLAFASVLPFCLIFASTWQINFVNQNLRDNDQIFTDGTFRIAPFGSRQLVTILYERSDPDTGSIGTVDKEAIPVMFILLKDKDFKTYDFVWREVVQLLYRLPLVDIFVSIDFEDESIQAIRKWLPKARIVGCNFHLKKAIDEWLVRKWNTTLQVAWKKEALHDVTALSRARYSEEEFKKDCDVFLYKWTSIDGGQFSGYMTRTWIGEYASQYSSVLKVKKAKFPPTMWAASLIAMELYNKIEYTNNQAELYHERLNSLFQKKPSIKKFIWVIRRIENNYRTTYVFNMQNFASVVNLPDEQEIQRELRFSDLRVAQPRVMQQIEQTSNFEPNEGYTIEEPNNEEQRSQNQPTVPALPGAIVARNNISPIVYESRLNVSKRTKGKRKALDPVQMALANSQVDYQASFEDISRQLASMGATPTGH